MQNLKSSFVLLFTSLKGPMWISYLLTYLLTYYDIPVSKRDNWVGSLRVYFFFSKHGDFLGIFFGGILFTRLKCYPIQCTSTYVHHYIKIIYVTIMIWKEMWRFYKNRFLPQISTNNCSFAAFILLYSFLHFYIAHFGQSRLSL